MVRRRAAQVVAVLVPMALLTAAPPVASAGDAGELRVETYLLPVRAAKPSLEALKNGDSMARLRQLAAAAEPQEQIANYASGGKQCDEYPFASTYEGAAEVEHDLEAKKFNFSVKPIPGPESEAGGNILTRRLLWR
jgi:hypothetical protein